MQDAWVPFLLYRDDVLYTTANLFCSGNITHYILLLKILINNAQNPKTVMHLVNVIIYCISRFLLKELAQ